ncbi:unnamed protein product [Urochloa decumbens]|uniref:CCHC-type domain-containing protein n=1 Tax=Urochloa decumbens TaxID=240449 RepID=A0ABC8YSS9_9POAL
MWSLNWRRVVRFPPPPRREPRPVPADLVGLCINCLQPGHMAVACRNPPRCLRCRQEGHAARACKRPRSPAAARAPEQPAARMRPTYEGRQQHRGSERQLNLPPPPPRVKIMLAPTRPRRGDSPPVVSPPADSFTPPGSLAASTPSGSPGGDTRRSGSPGREGPGSGAHQSSPDHGEASEASVSVPGASHRRPKVEICVVPWSASVEANVQELSSALFAMVAGTRPVVSPAQVELYMSEHFGLGRDDVEVRLSRPDDFLLVFRRRIDADRVLHAEPPPNAAFCLTYRRWRREAMASFEPLLFKVLLDMKGIPGHLWESEVAQRIVGSSCLIIQTVPDVASRRNMRTFTVAAWAVHPDLIPQEVVIVVPEKEEPFSPGNLFLRPEELIHASKGSLRYRVSVEIREVQDWRERSSSPSEDGRGYGGGSDDDSDGDDDVPGHGRGGRAFQQAVAAPAEILP